MSITAEKKLSEILQEIIAWRSSPDVILQEDEIPWTASHLSVVLDYVFKLEGISISEFSSTRYNNDDNLLDKPLIQAKIAKMVVIFAHVFRPLFELPKLDDHNNLKKSELVAAFMEFLLQLLHHKTPAMSSFLDRIESLEKELTFIVTVLGDTPFLSCADDEQVPDLVSEFEAVANDAGSLVFSFVSLSDQLFKSLRIDQELSSLLTRLDVLRSNVITLSDLLPLMMTPKTVYVDSLFILNSLLYDLEDLMSWEGGLKADVKDQIQKLHQGLMASQSLLKCIKAPPHSDIKEMKEAVGQIRDVAYEAEYLVNSFSVGDIPLLYLTNRLNHVIHKIKLTGTLLQELKNNYDNGDLTVTEDFGEKFSLRAKRNSEVDDITVGFEENATEILDQLVGGRDTLQMISIFGMAGLGKTTFTKNLYNHPSVNYRFDKRSWCVVSQTYQRKRLLIDILIGLKGEGNKDMIFGMEEENLVECIYKGLKGRRYLIVMDDVWDLNLWDDLRGCFPDDGNGSRILFTTRNNDVAPPNSIIHALPSLSNDQCWELLEHKLFHNAPCPPQLISIGKEIATNCCGLPLAVVVIAGVLSSMDNGESTWKTVGRNLASYIFHGGDNSMMEILELSYTHLPEHLKPCFLYFGVFPEDTEISTGKLIRLWIAEGFIHREPNKNAESVAEEYLKELIDKCLIMVAKRRSDGGVKACAVHDLLRDLCLKLSEESNFLKLVDNIYSIYEKGHHLVSLQHSATPFGHHARSFHGSRLESAFYVGRMKLLRVLDFTCIMNSARLIGGYMVQLRYLVINEFPAPIDNLMNLEFLFVGALARVKIPSVIMKMKKLKYVRTNLADFDENYDVSRTNNLEYLSRVHIHARKDEEKLKCSPNLRKLKCICEPFGHMVNGEYRYRYPDLRCLTNLESLNMTTTRIKRLGLIGVNFPSNIKKLTLEAFRLSWKRMSIIGELQKLQVLKLRSHAFWGKRWETRNGDFKELRYLKLAELGLVEWNVASSDHFPSLRKLVLHSCHHLKGIPCEIGEIATLQSIEVESCPKSVEESAFQIEQEQRDMGNEELKVDVRSLLDSWHWSDDDDENDEIDGRLFDEQLTKVHYFTD